MNILFSAIGLCSFLGAVALSINNTYDTHPAIVSSDTIEQDTTGNKNKRKDKYNDPIQVPPRDTVYNSHQVTPIDTIGNIRDWDTIGRFPDSLNR